MIVLYHFKLVKYEKFGQFMVFLGLSQFLPVYPKSFLPVYPRFIPRGLSHGINPPCHPCKGAVRLFFRRFFYAFIRLIGQF